MSDAVRRATFGGHADRDRVDRDLQLAMVRRSQLEHRVAEQWLRGLRLCMRIMPANVRTQLFDVVDNEDLDRRLAALEQSAAETAVALEDLGVTA